MINFFAKIISSSKNKNGFSLVELVVSIGIFAFMTTFMVAKYGNFNQSVLLTNLAYDVAVTVRSAQAYGLSVRGADGVTDSAKFQKPYGVYFDSTEGANTSFQLYTDNNLAYSHTDSAYSSASPVNVTTSYIKRGAKISRVCADNVPCIPSDINNSTKNISISFKRPDPNANICAGTVCGLSYAAIEVMGTDGTTRIITVRENGQISVKN